MGVFTVEVITLFPAVIDAYAGTSILGRAKDRGLISIRALDLRSYATGKHQVTDDAPYGGGAGMVMKVEPLVAAIEDAKSRLPNAKVYVMGPRGPRWDQAQAKAMARESTEVILVCGRYEGVDERVMDYVDGELSVGDFVLTGGELAALCVLDSVARLQPAVLGNVASAAQESFEEGLLEHPQYTRPPEFRGAVVPEVLQCGDHARIARWRRFQALKITEDRRPDLYAGRTLSKADAKIRATPEDKL